MPFPFMKLPFKNNQLEPFISEETMTFHYEKHYKKYITTLNSLVADKRLTKDSLKEALLKTHHIEDAIFQNAAQAWNHEFYWKCLSPEKQRPSKETLKALEEQFGSFQDFQNEFNQAATSLFGSGWVWVARDLNGEIKISALEKAETPLTAGEVPLLVCDLWEHAYYLDHQNDRSKYLENFWSLINWNFFGQNIQDSSALFKEAKGLTDENILEIS